MDISPFTCLSPDGLVGWAVRSIVLTFIIVFSRRFSHSLLPSLGDGDVGGDPGGWCWGWIWSDGLLGLLGWSCDHIVASA